MREPEIGEMQPLEALWRPERLRLDSWRDKRQEWQDVVERELAAELESDPFLALERAKDVALSAAREILGVSGGKWRSAIPHHLSDFKRTQARLRLLRVVRRELYARQEKGVQGSAAPVACDEQGLGCGLVPAARVVCRVL